MKLGRNNKIVILLFAFAIIIVPLSIHFAFVPEEQARIQSEWTAGELLGYCGAIIGAAATIFAINMTINFTMANQREARKLSIKPYMQTSSDPAYDVHENPYENYNAVFTTYGTPPYSTFHSPFVFKHEAHSPTEATAREIARHTLYNENYFILYEITNVGANNAVDVSLMINDQSIIPPFVIPVNSKKSFLIRVNTILLVENSLKLTFSIVFSDIASISSYEQHETVFIVRDTDEQFLYTMQSIQDLLTKPQEIPEVK